MRGTYVMNSENGLNGLYMVNAKFTPAMADAKDDSFIFPNIDYLAEASGELPCKTISEYDSKEYPLSPYMRSADCVDNMSGVLERLRLFSKEKFFWNKKYRMAFELFSEGSLNYLPTVIGNRMGNIIIFVIMI